MSRWARRTGLGLEDDPLRRGLAQASSSAAGAGGLLWSALARRCSIVARWCRRVLGGGIATILGLEVAERTGQERAALGRCVFEDLGRWRGLVMDGANLVGGKVLVVGGLKTEGSGCLVGGTDSKLGADPAPGQLLVGDPVIAAALNDVVEDLQKIKLVRGDLGLWVEPGSSLGVEFSQLVDELLVLGSAINNVLGGPLRYHRGRLCPQRGARGAVLLTSQTKR